MTTTTERNQKAHPPTGGTAAKADPAGRLPRAVSSFVGRARELGHLTEVLRDARLVTLTGPSGIGKTRLALEAAGRLASGYPDGAWLVELAPLSDPDLVPRAVADALRLPPEPGLDPTEAVVAHLRAHPALLVLDNCENVLVACATICDRLLEAVPHLRVLATSQRSLDTRGERAVPVSPMSLPEPGFDAAADEAMRSEAVALFCARAQASTPAFRLTDEVVPAVVEICLRLEGLPLAIELAAARANVLAPGEIAERLEDRFALLTRGPRAPRSAGPLVPGAAPARHHTLRAALDWSCDLLSPAEAATLRRLSVFTGGATLRAAEEVCAGGEVRRTDVLDHVSELVARSLVAADISGPRARYRLLETVREHGRERLVEAGELECLRSRHAAWCLGFAEGASHRLFYGNQEWVDTVEVELDNLRSALEWAVAGHEPRLGLRVAMAITPIWKIRGQFREGQAWLDRTLRSNPGAPAPLRARALWSLGMLAVLQGDVAAATPAVEESLALARAHGLRRAEAQGLNLLGFISIFSQDALSAMPLLEESVALARSVGDMGLLVNALALYGRSHLFAGDVAAARQVFGECLEMTGEDLDQRIDSLIGLAWTALVAGERREAEKVFGRVLPMVRSAGERFDTALVLSFLGELAEARGDQVHARALLDEGLALAQAMGAPFPAVRCLCTLARVHLSEGDPAGAEVLIEEACARCRTSRLPYAYVRCLHVRGAVRLASDDEAGAKASFEEALAAARGNGDDAGVAASLHRLAGLARRRGACARAAALHTEALAMADRIPDAAGITGSLEGLAGLAAAVGRHAHAARLLGAAQAIRDGSGSTRPPEEVATYDADVAGLRCALGSSDFDDAWAGGTALSRAEAVALATKGRGPRDRPVHGVAALTPGERQVVELAAVGLTNSEIGEKLFISARTVQGRLLRIFPKLGVKSRRQLREFVTDR